MKQFPVRKVKEKYPSAQWYTKETIPNRWHVMGNKERSPDILGMVPFGGSWWNKNNYTKGIRSVSFNPNRHVTSNVCMGALGPPEGETTTTKK